ncbi:predicted protein [Arabidopsis lyrata subsp. lyrata]|uniref:Predicted protein n=1 Tax=Arabidopsis lyrata subsp. lyrata TaxID=81972 RepID=D7MH19_ARALL|nr:predicted protein [Arabidopsis lyrata subsp. lyrata]EFH44542.1 predicted protein [Arabidopsis lyrata subsp. lyrata]
MVPAVRFPLAIEVFIWPPRASRKHTERWAWTARQEPASSLGASRVSVRIRGL